MSLRRVLISSNSDSLRSASLIISIDDGNDGACGNEIDDDDGVGSDEIDDDDGACGNEIDDDDGAYLFQAIWSKCAIYKFQFFGNVNSKSNTFLLIFTQNLQYFEDNNMHFLSCFSKSCNKIIYQFLFDNQVEQ